MCLPKDSNEGQPKTNWYSHVQSSSAQLGDGFDINCSLPHSVATNDPQNSLLSSGHYVTVQHP